MGRMTLAHAQTNYHVSQLVTEIKKMLTRSEIGTPVTLRGETSSIVCNCAYNVPMTNEPLQYVRLNPIPEWKLAREVTCRCKSVWGQHTWIWLSLMNCVPRQASEPICLYMTVVPRMTISDGFLLCVKFHAALRFSAFTIVYLHQLTNCCLCSSRCTVIQLRVNDCISWQFGCSVPQILLMMQDEKLFTLNFIM